jgi:hypothetical protein
VGTVPGTGHLITPAAVQATIEFFESLLLHLVFIHWQCVSQCCYPGLIKGRWQRVAVCMKEACGMVGHLRQMAALA